MAKNYLNLAGYAAAASASSPRNAARSASVTGHVVATAATPASGRTSDEAILAAIRERGHVAPGTPLASDGVSWTVTNTR